MIKPLRQSQTARIVLSADALLLAGVTFLLDKALLLSTQYSTFERVLLGIGIGVTVLLLTASVAFAVNGLANVWKISRELFGADMPRRLFFHTRDTVETFRGFVLFDESFRTTSTEQMMTYALGDLWTRINQQHKRYQILRKAIRLLALSIVSFVLSIAVLMLRLF